MNDVAWLESPEKYQQLYSTLLDAIPSSVLLVDKNLRITSANRNFLEKSQRSMTTTIGQRLEDVFPTIILEHTDIKRRVHDVFKKKKPIRGQRMTYRAPGIPIRTYYYSLLPILCSEIDKQVMLLMEDVTEQVRLSEEVRRMEQHLAGVVESASDIVLSTDMAGRILTWNSAAEKLSGLRFHEVKERYFFEFCGQGETGEARELFAFMSSGSESRTAEWELRGRVEESIPVSWVFSPMRDDYGKTVGVVAVGRDLTEQRKLEAQLRQSQKLAALGVMAGGIAHEIRNPLAVCSSAAQFLCEKAVTEDFRIECAEKIQAGIQKASTIIENLLRFARPSATAEMERVNLVTVLSETLTLIANQAKVKKIDITRQFTGHSMLVHGVPSLLQQVFMNLCLNAINAMADGGTLSIDLAQTHREAVIKVSDSGVGIAETDIDKIFDPFHTTRLGNGTGLGLSICYTIVKQHLGAITVDSRVNEGSTFTVRLPLL